MNELLTAEITPTTAQPITTLSIHDRSAGLAHSCRCRRTRRKRRCRTIGRTVAEPGLTCICATVEVLALDVVLGAAVAAGTAAAVEISGYVGTGRDAGAGTGDTTYSMTADVDVRDRGDVGGSGG